MAIAEIKHVQSGEEILSHLLEKFDADNPAENNNHKLTEEEMALSIGRVMNFGDYDFNKMFGTTRIDTIAELAEKDSEAHSHLIKAYVTSSALLPTQGNLEEQALWREESRKPQIIYGGKSLIELYSNGEFAKILEAQFDRGDL